MNVTKSNPEQNIEAATLDFDAMKRFVDKLFKGAGKFFDYFAKMDEDEEYKNLRVGDTSYWGVNLMDDEDGDEPSCLLKVTITGANSDDEDPENCYYIANLELKFNDDSSGPVERKSGVKIGTYLKEDMTTDLVDAVRDMVDKLVDGDRYFEEIVPLEASSTIQLHVKRDGRKHELRSVMGSEDTHESLSLLQQVDLSSVVHDDDPEQCVYSITSDGEDLVVDVEEVEDVDSYENSVMYRSITAIMRELTYLQADLQYIIWNAGSFDCQEIRNWCQTLKCRCDLQIDMVSLTASKLLGFVDHPATYLNDMTFSNRDYDCEEAESLILSDIEHVKDVMELLVSNFDDDIARSLQGYINTWEREIACRFVL